MCWFRGGSRDRLVPESSAFIEIAADFSCQQRLILSGYLMLMTLHGKAGRWRAASLWDYNSETR